LSAEADSAIRIAALAGMDRRDGPTGILLPLPATRYSRWMVYFMFFLALQYSGIVRRFREVDARENPTRGVALAPAYRVSVMFRPRLA